MICYLQHFFLKLVQRQPRPNLKIRPIVVEGAWMTFKKAEMAKILRNRLSMIETNPLNHNWLDF